MTFDATGATVRYSGAVGDERPNDAATNADGSRIYTSGNDGNLRIYDADTGALIQTIDVGNRLGGMDVSPDGSFLVVTELDPLESHVADPWWDNQFTVTTYKVDLTTGAVTSYPTTVTGDEYAFYDVAVLADGNVLLTEQILPGWSGWVSMKLLDLNTGTYTVASDQIRMSSVISATDEGTYAFVGEIDTSDAPVDLYQSGAGVVAHHGLYADNVQGFNSGVQAISSAAGLAVQYVPGNGLHVYNLQLQYQENLFDLYPALNGGITGLAFDDSGQYLFILNSSTDTIIQLSTSDWSTIDTFDVGFDVSSYGGGFANNLILGPDLRYFLVADDNGLFEVNNPSVSSTITGTSGVDDLMGTGLFDEIVGSGGDDVIHGLGGNDILAGGDGTDSLHGDAGDDRLDGGAGNDLLDGGGGSDTADYRAATGAVTVDLNVTTAQSTSGAGSDTLVSIENVDGTAFNDTITGDAGSNRLTGGAGNDSLSGGDGDDELNGGAGDDSLSGGAGADTVSYFGSAAGVTVSLALSGPQDTIGAGTDTLSSFSNLRGSNFADSLTGSSGSNMIFGEGGNDTISAGAGNDTIDGGAGADAMSGGTGNDRYIVDNAGDVVTEALGEGTDEVRSTVSVTLGANVENLRLLGSGAINGTGNALDNFIYGNDSANSISGQDGADDLRGYGGNDIINGGAGNDAILGGYGNDVLIGGAAADTMDGGAGDDVYIINSAAEHVGAEISDYSGTDELRFAALSSSTLTLGGEVGIERVVIGTGTGALANTTGTIALNIDASTLGNALTMIGNDGANVIKATAFNDTVTGGAGDDYLYGNAGNDTLDGGLGADRVYGGTGNDTYIVDNSADYLVELDSDGTDSVMASVNFVLRANIENLTLTGFSDIGGRGNALPNIINGNDGANLLYGYDGNDRLYGQAGNDRLDGGLGADRLEGGWGNDTYVVDNAGDVTVEGFGQGMDSVYSSVSFALRANLENLYLTGTADLVGRGNELDNRISGNAGANVLYGYDGNDNLTGSAGADVIDGGNGNDSLAGGTEDDKLYGRAGADVLKGEDGNDLLDGGAGRDVFYGGTGSDNFFFRDGDFAGLTLSTCDQIKDFSQADGDHIRLSLVDADATLSGDQAFTLVGTNAFSGTAGELRYEQISGNTYVSGDTNGDGVADFLIRLDGLHTLNSGDFVL